MKIIALILAAVLTSSAIAAPGIDLKQGNDTTSLELTFQAGNTPVSGFDLHLTFNSNQAEVTYICEQILSDAVVECEIVKKNTLRILVEVPYVVNIPIVESQHLATVDFEFLSPRAVTFTIKEEHYFDAEGNNIKPRKGKKRWKSKKP